jgi:hypothetical protein
MFYIQEKHIFFMAFDYLSGSASLTNMLFSQILKISDSTIYHYATIQDQVIYLLLIPHVILFLFIYAFSIGIVARITGGHVGFSRLMGIVVYIYMVWAGWYGALVPLLNMWLNIALIGGLIVFLVTAIMHPAKGTKLEELGGKIGGSIGDKLGKAALKDKTLEKLYEDKIHIEKQIAMFSAKANRGEHGANSALEVYIDKLKEVKDHIKRLEE